MDSLVGDWNSDGKIESEILKDSVWNLDVDGTCSWTTEDKMFI
jgi:hypothetical protein